MTPRAHRTKAKAKVKAHVKAKTAKPKLHKARATQHPKTHELLAARASKRAVPTSRVSSPALSGSGTASGGVRDAVVILLFLIPAIVLGAAFVPPHAMPHRMALAWRDVRLNVGLLAGSALLVEGLFYLLTR